MDQQSNGESQAGFPQEDFYETGYPPFGEILLNLSQGQPAVFSESLQGILARSKPLRSIFIERGLRSWRAQFLLSVGGKGKLCRMPYAAFPEPGFRRPRLR